MGAFRHETALMAAAIREFGFRSTVWGFGGRAVQEFWVRSFSLRHKTLKTCIPSFSRPSDTSLAKHGTRRHGLALGASFWV